ncbi:MAG: VWA domain-containing protein [Bacteroidales bacterium]|nr:VWA domain-containing protein [Bacteroidales bacterium]
MVLKRSSALLLLALLVLTLCTPLYAQRPAKAVPKNKSEKPRPSSKKATAEKTHLLILLDCSKSMWDTWQSDAKIKITQKVLLHFVDSLARRDDVEVALRVFGHLSDDQQGTRLEVPFDDNNFYQLHSKIKALVPNGDCNAAEALHNSLSDFRQQDSRRNIMLVITDGVDDCAGNLCHEAQQVLMSGVVVQTFIVGIGPALHFQQPITCAGHFQQVEDEERFSAALFDVLRLSKERANVLLRLTDSDGIAYETTLPVVFYDSLSGIAKHATLLRNHSERTGDTLVVDPLNTYYITLYTKPETTLSARRFVANQTSTLNMVIDQGQLAVRFVGPKTTWATPSYDVQVHQHGDVRVLARQNMGDIVDYRAGRYDIEVLTTPPTKLLDIEVRSDASTDLALPAPGPLTIGKPKQPYGGSVFAVLNGSLSWVCDLATTSASERILLMPGNYQVMAAPLRNNDPAAVKVLSFTIESGGLRHISL